MEMARGVVSLCMGSGRLRRTHPAAMGVGYTDGLGAGKGADIRGATAYSSQSRDLCCIAANCDTEQLCQHLQLTYYKMFMAILNGVLYHMALKIHNLSRILPYAFSLFLMET
jgi:hypothetical protein